MPAVWVTSIKMTGAPSTKPPAVIGRESASFTGACVPPVLMPLCGLRTGSFSAGFCPDSAEFRRRIAQMAWIAEKRETHPSWRDLENGIRPRVGLTTGKHLRTELASRSNLWTRRPRDMLGRFDAGIYVNHRATLLRSPDAQRPPPGGFVLTRHPDKGF
jgi:hypothetical protein